LNRSSVGTGAFDRDALDPEIFDLMEHDEALEGESGRYKSKVRFATVDDLIFAHSGFPTAEPDAVRSDPMPTDLSGCCVPPLPMSPRAGLLSISGAQRGWRNCRGSVARQAH
jgi:hypothetical protein